MNMFACMLLSSIPIQTLATSISQFPLRFSALNFSLRKRENSFVLIPTLSYEISRRNLRVFDEEQNFKKMNERKVWEDKNREEMFRS